MSACVWVSECVGGCMPLAADYCRALVRRTDRLTDRIRFRVELGLTNVPALTENACHFRNFPFNRLYTIRPALLLQYVNKKAQLTQRERATAVHV